MRPSAWRSRGCVGSTPGATRTCARAGSVVARRSAWGSRGGRPSALGVGRDFGETLLRQMAEAGGGNFYFAERAEQLSDFIAGETGEALKVVAREAALVVDLPAGASVGSPNQFPMRAEQ